MNRLGFSNIFVYFFSVENFKIKDELLKERVHIVGQQFHQYQEIKQKPLFTLKKSWGKFKLMGTSVQNSNYYTPYFIMSTLHEQLKWKIK